MGFPKGWMGVGTASNVVNFVASRVVPNATDLRTIDKIKARFESLSGRGWGGRAGRLKRKLMKINIFEFAPNKH